jgi:hypothetical protein
LYPASASEAVTIADDEIATKPATSKPTFFNTASFVVDDDAKDHPSRGENWAGFIRLGKAFH